MKETQSALIIVTHQTLAGFASCIPSQFLSVGQGLSGFPGLINPALSRKMQTMAILILISLPCLKRGHLIKKKEVQSVGLTILSTKIDIAA